MDTLDPGVVTSNQDTYYGCVPLDKTNTVVIDGGAPATVVYTIRDAAGNPIDLSKFFIQNDPNDEENANGIFLKYSVADGTQISKFVEQGYVLDAENGKVQFDIPEYVYDIPCIYTFHIAVADKQTYISSGRAMYVAPTKGFLLVEWTPFVLHNKHCPMKHRIVPSVEDVRRKLDDWQTKNNFLNQVEYSADDIVNALLWPVREFNETPPRLKRYHYTLMNFPYYEHWVLGASSELLRLSVVHYMRNKMLSAHGGIQGDEMNRDREYLQIAAMYREEFKKFVRSEKFRLNMTQPAFGTLHSDYVYLQTFR